jgi:hypothetical protein
MEMTKTYQLDEESYHGDGDGDEDEEYNQVSELNSKETIYQPLYNKRTGRKIDNFIQDVHDINGKSLINNQGFKSKYSALNTESFFPIEYLVNNVSNL